MKSVRALLICCVLGAALVLAGCGSAMSGGSKPTTPSVAPAAGGVTVAIKNFAFAPATVTIKVGDTVTWRNDDGVPHDATSATWTSGQISAGQSYTRTFDAAGTFSYVCKVHPAMKAATIIVK
jgi:plastocyanin